MKTLSGRNKAFNLSFHSCSIKEWCALTEEIGKIVSANKFKEIMFSFIRSKQNTIFEIHDTKGIKLLICVRLNFSHLNEHKFKFRHGFRETVDPMCKCGLGTDNSNNTPLSLVLQAAFYY